nr:hypothetical protein [uncultured Campylobacter sp.]
MFEDIKTSTPPILEIVAEIFIESPDPEALVVGNLQKIAVECNFKSIGVANLQRGGESESPEGSLIWMGYEYGDDDRINFLFGPKTVAFNWAKHPDDDDDDTYLREEAKIKSIFYSLFSKIPKIEAVEIKFKTLRYKITNALENLSFFENSNFKVSINNEDLVSAKKIRSLMYKEKDDILTRTITVTAPATLYSETYKKTIKKTIVEILSEVNINSYEEMCEKIEAMNKKNKDTFFSLLKKNI